MPMSNENGSLWIRTTAKTTTFADLRRELEGKGHCFASNTDTEVIVHLYEELRPRLRYPAERNVRVRDL